MRVNCTEVAYFLSALTVSLSYVVFNVNVERSSQATILSRGTFVTVTILSRGTFVTVTVLSRGTFVTVTVLSRYTSAESRRYSHSTRSLVTSCAANSKSSL